MISPLVGAALHDAWRAAPPPSVTINPIGSPGDAQPLSQVIPGINRKVIRSLRRRAFAESTMLRFRLSSDRDDPAWNRRAGCLGVDPDLMFPETREDQVEALAICDRCPVRMECGRAAFLIESDQPFQTHGVRGGLLPSERLRFYERIHR